MASFGKDQHHHQVWLSRYTAIAHHCFVRSSPLSCCSSSSCCSSFSSSSSTPEWNYSSRGRFLGVRKVVRAL
ncbi:hypothetical protein E2C01_076550 [Portunus trituberculatus]|uniref:Uncharacterized protein n=1 Tax=Portunus trituberculatus TaxID=210409 RepID=A0A5B7I902_PORTR|nr:hypothetical protein [Portunus trituberculatus]